jgi:serine phosphatase RsbU (regulator of sigma subunit)
MPGNCALLTPVRDSAGEIEDFRFAAVSPATSDVAGRQGHEMVGLGLRKAYGRSVKELLWRTLLDVYADGVARTCGPFRYAGPVTSVPASLRFTVSVRRTGAGLLYSWTRSDEQRRLSERMARLERLGNLGWSEQDLAGGNHTWSDHLYRIYERDPAAGPLSADESEAVTLPADRPVRRQAAERLGRGRSVDVTYRIRVNGRVKHIRAVGDTVRDVHGRPLKIYGFVQDVTAWEANRTRLANVEQQLREHRESLAAENALTAELQHIILPIPAGPVDLGGLRVVVRYLPAEEASRIGGDWYHATAAYDGSVVLAVGDVAGHGLRVAATMAQLRQALATLAATATTDPAELLSYLNRLLFADSTTATIASAVVARYDVSTSTMTWAQAGHPAPLRSRAGETVAMTRPAGPMLGTLPRPTYGTATTRFVPGDLLLFYTDGLIERRDRSFEEGLRPVVATLNRLSAQSTPHPLEGLVAQLDRANPDDDTCLLAVRPLAAGRAVRPAGVGSAMPPGSVSVIDRPADR